MDEYNIVILMKKDLNTGYLTETIDSYHIESNIDYIESIYLTEEKDEHYINLILTTYEVEAFEYYGIYDLYDEDAFSSMNIQVEDGSGESNPRWIIRFIYIQDRKNIENTINNILKLHNTEIERIKPIIQANKDKYIEEAIKEEQ